MHPILQSAGRFEDLLALGEHDAPYAFEGIFRNDGFAARRLSAKKLKLLKAIDTRLRSLLDDGERVRFLTFGSGLSFWESYVLGWAGYFMNRRAIALTDRRILLLQIDWQERPRELLSQIRYPAIERMKRTLLGNLSLRLNGGTKQIFQGVPRADRKLLQELSTRMRERVAADDGGIQELCPHCFAIVDGRPARCAVCGGPFKSARTAALRSLLFPGLGDVYLGHWKFAILEILFAAFVWIGVLAPDPKYPMTLLGFVVVASILVLLIHVPDALLSRHIGRKGIYPAGGTVGARVALRRKMEARRAGEAQATPIAQGVVGGSSGDHGSALRSYR